MESIKISVIIPVYNTAKYLNEALSSITNQTLKDIEIITVNDGSADNSLEILNQFSKIDTRIKVISFDKNVGVSVSRNAGIEKAKGEFVYFFDSDDILDPDCLELCYLKCLEDKTDFLIFDGVSFVHEGVKSAFNPNYERTHHLKNKIYSGKEILLELNKHNGYSCSVCLSFIRSEFLKKIDLKFYPGILFEDVLFTIILYLSAEKVNFINRSFFHRRIRSNSTMTTSIDQQNIEYRLKVCSEIIQYKKVFTDTTSKSLLDLQVRNVLKFLIKNLIRSFQYRLFLANMFKICNLYMKASF